MMERSLEKKLFQLNLFFIFIFLNTWDYVINRTFFNGMLIGLVMFTPSTFLWFVGKLRAVALMTLISIFEFIIMLIFVAEGFQLGGAAITIKSVYWIPYFVMAGVNMAVGLKIYSDVKERALKAKKKANQEDNIQAAS
ncbi:MAG TPA: hypothetical protein VLE91_02490 [Candidatus Saccharimonadales bacterium]|nr:hypothetical protein [Candidatus Saccharimonadales bacterium]